MLKLDNLRTIEGLTVHGDDLRDDLYYVMPEHPTISRLDTGGLALRFVEYGQLREDGGKKFGGFVAFDADLSIPDASLKKVTASLQAELDAKYQGRQAPKAAIAPINWLDGTVSLVLKQGDLVETVNAAAKPSLVGKNIACFSLELTELGTAVFKETLSTGAASTIQVVYNLRYYARLPEMNAWGVWNASEFYSFFESVTTDKGWLWRDDSYTEVINSSRYKNDVTKTHFEFAGNPNFTPEQQAKFEEQITNAINQQLGEAVKRNLLQAITDADPDVKALQDDQGMEEITRQIHKTQMANVRIEWSEAKAIITEKNPQGMLPSVTSLTDAKGKPLRWEDYYSKINVDEFLKTVQVSLQVSADFTDLPIHSVEVKVRYPHGPNAKTKEFVFTKADDNYKFEAFVHEGIRKVFYSYKVNYKNSTFSYQSKEVETDDTNLVVPVDDLGILTLDITDGDINFDQVQRAEIQVGYAGAVKVEEHYNMTRDDKEFRLREIIKEPRNKPVTYDVTFEMADGRQIASPQKSLEGNVLFVNDPFAAQRTVSVRAVGDLDNDISSITLNLLYTDDVHGYTQRKTVTLSEDLSVDEWSFPTIDDRSGTVSYEGIITRHDGTTEPIPETTAKGSIVTAGDLVADFLEISVIPDMIDWTLVKLVSVSLHYIDAANKVDERADLTLRSGDVSKQWRVAQKDKAVFKFNAATTYFFLNGIRTV